MINSLTVAQGVAVRAKSAYQWYFGVHPSYQFSSQKNMIAQSTIVARKQDLKASRDLCNPCQKNEQQC